MSGDPRIGGGIPTFELPEALVFAFGELSRRELKARKKLRLPTAVFDAAPEVWEALEKRGLVVLRGQRDRRRVSLTRLGRECVVYAPKPLDPVTGVPAVDQGELTGAMPAGFGS